MTVQIETHKITQEVLHVKAHNKLIKEDYEKFVPLIENMLERGKIRILFELHDFNGWTTSAAWEDTKFGVKYFNDIERLAIVGNKTLEKGMSLLCKVFTTADVQFFEADDIDKAKYWIGLKKIKGGESNNDSL